MTQIELAYFIADIAHRAAKQMRADGVTPYIEHPERVADLVIEGYKALVKADIPCGIIDLNDCVAAAWLHDVIEDTGLTFDDLLRYGVKGRVLKIVLLMTKPNDDPATPEYYQGIASDPNALLVKWADRYANLETASSFEPQRWANYLAKTRRDVLPLYDKWPTLQEQMRDILADAEKVCNKALDDRERHHADRKAKWFAEHPEGVVKST